MCSYIVSYKENNCCNLFYLFLMEASFYVKLLCDTYYTFMKMYVNSIKLLLFSVKKALIHLSGV